MKFETVLKTWQVEKNRWDFKIDLMHDFTIRSASKYGENLLNPNSFLMNWFGFSSDKKQEIEIIIEILALIPLSMMAPEVKRMALFYANYHADQSWTNQNLRPDQEFFFGPRVHSLPAADRIEIKKKYVKLTSNAFQTSDGFFLFDYAAIELSKEVRNNSGGEDYFHIKKGKVTYGGYDGANNGGFQDWDLESVFYWPSDLFNLLTNQQFKSLQPVVQNLCRAHIIQE
jgi:hypothetical protein